jgi:hypothetical protein
MENAVVLFFKRRLKSVQVALEGFPWKLATVLYTLSWGWSLLRPNTLYWDDWTYIYGRPKSYLNEIFVDTGLPPWRALIDQELIAVGYWTIPALTFMMFFASSLFLHNILRKFDLANTEQIRIAVLVALLLPVNHSRISLQMFGYTTSYFLFFLAWMLLINHRRRAQFCISILLFFWSFMTHSFLFFYLLPVVHYILLQKSVIKELRIRYLVLPKTILLIAIPVLYYILRLFFWPPTAEYENYHKVTLDGAIRGVAVFAVGSLLLLIFSFALKAFGLRDKSMLLPFIGWTLFAWGLFPYFTNQSLVDIVSVFAFRADWGSRHLLLTPLGAGLLVYGLAQLLNKHLRIVFVNTLLLIFVCCNVFFGSQYFLDSIKKEQLIEIFRNTDQLSENRNIIFIDETKRFNGRYSTYRDTELKALVELSGRTVESISGKTSCEQTSDGIQLTLISKKSYINALLSRNLDLYFVSQEC